MGRVPVLINRGGGTASADPDIGKTVESALREAGIDADVELLDGGNARFAASRSRSAMSRS